MIIPIYQPLGSSTHQLAKKVGELYNTKATHTGTLDPMAEGVVVVLTGEDRFRKQELASWEKLYTFKVLLGISTDTHDLLGIVEKVKINKQFNLKQNLANIIPEFIGEQLQQLPKFSAKRINGESYFDKAKRRENFEAKKQKITISKIIISKINYISIQNFQQKTQQKISLVRGDFRQNKVLEKWTKTFKHLQEKNIKHLPLITLQATTSKRTYIRALVRDIGERLKIPATTYSIVRERNGLFSIGDTTCLKRK